MQTGQTPLELNYMNLYTALRLDSMTNAAIVYAVHCPLIQVDIWARGVTTSFQVCHMNGLTQGIGTS